jgi:hypothetical protein
LWAAFSYLGGGKKWVRPSIIRSRSFPGTQDREKIPFGQAVSSFKHLRAFFSRGMQLAQATHEIHSPTKGRTMKKNLIVTVIAGSLISIIGSGCDSLQNAAGNAQAGVSASELQHKWQQNQCASIGSLKLIGASVQTTYEFSGEQITKTDQIFSSANCTDPAVSIAYVGTFNKRDQVSDGVFQIDIAYQNVTVTAQNDVGVKVLGDTKFCGDGTWTVNQGVNLTAQARDALCPLDALPETKYDIYSVQNDTLIFGQGDDNSTPDKRQTALDSSDPYHQM